MYSLPGPAYQFMTFTYYRKLSANVLFAFPREMKMGKNKDVFKNYGFISDINLYYLNSDYVKLIRGQSLKIVS